MATVFCGVKEPVELVLQALATFSRQLRSAGDESLSQEGLAGEDHAILAQPRSFFAAAALISGWSRRLMRLASTPQHPDGIGLYRGIGAHGHVDAGQRGVDRIDIWIFVTLPMGMPPNSTGALAGIEPRDRAVDGAGSDPRSRRCCWNISTPRAQRRSRPEEGSGRRRRRRCKLGPGFPFMARMVSGPRLPFHGGFGERFPLRSIGGGGVCSGRSAAAGSP